MKKRKPIVGGLRDLLEAKKENQSKQNKHLNRVRTKITKEYNHKETDRQIEDGSDRIELYPDVHYAHRQDFSRTISEVVRASLRNTNSKYSRMLSSSRLSGLFQNGIPSDLVRRNKIRVCDFWADLTFNNIQGDIPKNINLFPRQTSRNLWDVKDGELIKTNIEARGIYLIETTHFDTE